MKAILTSITRPVGELADLTAEQLIVHKARVSNPSNQFNHDTGAGLLRHCLSNGHWSVFDMVDVTFEIETSRAIMAQVLRHWSFRFQEFSQRYATVDVQVQPEQWPDVETRFKAAGGNRQGSDDGPPPMGLTHLAQTACAAAAKAYRRLIESDIAPECARMVLPLATPTRAYMKGSVRSWITYFWQRLDSHAQKEHRLLAELIFPLFAAEFPLIAEMVLAGRMRYITGEEWAIIEAIRAGKGNFQLNNQP